MSEQAPKPEQTPAARVPQRVAFSHVSKMPPINNSKPMKKAIPLGTKRPNRAAKGR